MRRTFEGITDIWIAGVIYDSDLELVTVISVCRTDILSFIHLSGSAILYFFDQVFVG